MEERRSQAEKWDNKCYIITGQRKTKVCFGEVKNGRTQGWRGEGAWVIQVFTTLL